MEIEVKNETTLYRVEELRDEILNSINNINSIIKETQELNAVLNKYAKRKFKNFIKAQEEQVKGLTDRRKELEKKLDNVDIIIETARHDNEKGAYLDLILNTLIQF